MQRHSNYSRGFTLLEAVIVVGITAVVGLALSNMIVYFYRTNDYILQEGAAVQNARSGLGIAVQNLREASYGDDGSYPIGSAGTSTITFYADVNGGAGVQKIIYYLKGQTLYRAVTASAGSPPSYSGQPTSTTTVATYIQNTGALPIFQYYDNNGTLLTYPISLSSVSTITTTLKIDVDPNRSPSPYTLIGSATLRNLNN